MPNPVELPVPFFTGILLESRCVLEFTNSIIQLPFLLQTPRGDGHPVVVVPGFLTTDASTGPLRSFLRMKGYATYGWGLGRNLGKELVSGQSGINEELADVVKNVSEAHQSKVSLIGWSLGGIQAREVARHIPDCIRQVICLGSPFNDAATGAPKPAKLFRMLHKDTNEAKADLVHKARIVPPVPCTAIYSPTDGVAHWRACMQDAALAHDHFENIEVDSSHLGISYHSDSLRIIADRLAQPEHHWQPYKASER